MSDPMNTKLINAYIKDLAMLSRLLQTRLTAYGEEDLAIETGHAFTVLSRSLRTFKKHWEAEHNA